METPDVEREMLYVVTMQPRKFNKKAKRWQEDGAASAIAAYRNLALAERTAAVLNDYFCDKGYVYVDLLDLIEVGGEDDA